jgi:hypothetical protein
MGGAEDENDVRERLLRALATSRRVRAEYIRVALFPSYVDRRAVKLLLGDLVAAHHHEIGWMQVVCCRFRVFLERDVMELELRKQCRICIRTVRQWRDRRRTRDRG